jgi:hypothetical protein
MTRTLGLFLIALAIVIDLAGAIVLAVVFAGDQVDLCMVTGAVVALILGTLLLIAGIAVLRRGKPLESRSATVPTGTPVGNYTASIPDERELDGVPYTVLYTPPVKGKHARPSVLRISTRIDVDGEFEIVPESNFDRFAKRWGLAREIQTFDESFDHHCFVRSDTVEFTEAYLGNPDNRGIIANLHEMGFKSVAMQNREIRAEWVGFDPVKNDTPDLVEEVGARLILLARKLPADLPSPDLRAGQRRRKWQLALWASVILFAATILGAMTYRPVRTGDLILRAAPVCLTGFPIALVIAAMVLRGTSRSHYAWRSWAVGGLFLFPVGSAGTVASLNGLLDDSQPVVHEARIVRKYTTRSKNSTNYHVECESWRDGGDTEDFKVSSSEYSSIVEGQSRLIVTTRAGGLGIEWVRGKQVGPHRR